MNEGMNGGPPYHAFHIIHVRTQIEELRGESAVDIRCLGLLDELQL